MSIGEKIRKARLAADLTQEVVAEKVGVSRQTMSNWENGRSYPDIANIIILSDMYGMTLDSLLKGDEQMMKHLKESTDVTKSNKQLATSFLLAGAFCVALILVRVFVPIPRIGGVIPSIIAVAVLFVGLIVALAGTINIKQVSKKSTSNKKLIRVGMILLYVMIYVPLLIVVPEAISSGFQIESELSQMVIKGATAVILLTPAIALYKKFHYLFTK